MSVIGEGVVEVDVGFNGDGGPDLGEVLDPVSEGVGEQGEGDDLGG